MRIFGKRECERCGEAITAFCPSLKTLSSVGGDVLGPQDALERKIATLEGVTLEVAREYLEHRMIQKCEALFGICPNCSGKLATRAARQCLHCHTSWHTQ
jgi:hypothetical protein